MCNLVNCSIDNAVRFSKSDSYINESINDSFSVDDRPTDEHIQCNFTQTNNANYQQGNEIDCFLEFDDLPKFDMKHGITIAHLNVRTLLPNLDQVKILLQDNNLDVFALNETRLCSFVDNMQVRIDDYVVYRHDRNRQGGGVLVYINEKRLKHTLRSDLMSGDIELVAVEISQQKSASVVILAWYRPPGSNMLLFEYVEQILLKLDSENKDIILLGDFNCDILATSQSCYTRKLIEICDRYSLNQVINRPTRIVENSRTLIDVIFSSDTSKIVKCGVSHIGISDHSLVYVIWGKSRGTQPHHVYKTYRNFKNFSESEFQECVSNIDWSLVCNNFDVNESANQFLNLLLKCCNKFAPIRKKKVKKDSLPWINSDILKLMRERDAMKRKAIEINTEDEWKSYRKIRNYVIAKLKYMKKEYFQSRIEFSRGKVKQTWNHLNRLMSRNKKSSEISNVICEDIDILIQNI